MVVGCVNGLRQAVSDMTARTGLGLLAPRVKHCHYAASAAGEGLRKVRAKHAAHAGNAASEGKGAGIPRVGPASERGKR